MVAHDLVYAVMWVGITARWLRKRNQDRVSTAPGRDEEMPIAEGKSIADSRKRLGAREGARVPTADRHTTKPDN